MGTLTIKISDDLERALERTSRRQKLTKSELARRALASYIGQQQTDPGFVSALDRAADLVGCFEGGPKDLASHARHMDGFGKV